MLRVRKIALNLTFDVGLSMFGVHPYLYYDFTYTLQRVSYNQRAPFSAPDTILR